MSDINICCPYLLVVGCNDTEEHSHVICEIAQEVQEDCMITNQKVKVMCLGRSFKLCGYYRRFGEMMERMEMVYQDNNGIDGS